MTSDNFGHLYASSGSTFIDGWGLGPYTLRVGKRRYYFSDSDMFGPLLENKSGRVLDRQPTDAKHPFWAAYHMWRSMGRQGKMVSRWTVCRWRAPRPGQYWKTSTGKIMFLCDPEFEPLDYVCVPKPMAHP